MLVPAPSMVDGAGTSPRGARRGPKETAMNHHHARARADFERAHRRAVLGGLMARLCRRHNDLLAYHEVRRGLAVVAESYRGVRAVPVDRIVGSTDRCRDFDRAFRPCRAHGAGRWVSVACAHGAGTSLPPIQLYRVGDAYFVRDGHHRVSVARARGQAAIDAEVTEVLAPRLDHPQEDTAMMLDPTIFATARAEHALRVRAAQRAGAAAAVARERGGGTARTPLRRRAGGVLVALGHRLQGTPPAAGVGGLGRVAG
jgi:hypothetical protein